MFAFEVGFLTGRYVATAYDNRDRAEWPPHPARLFSALVATHFEAPEPSIEERAALAWLEELGPPEITASDASEREVATVFVPINDVSVVSSVDDEAQAVTDAREAIEAAQGAGAKGVPALEKKLAKAEARFADAVRKAIAPVSAGKEGKDGPPRAASLLPENRGKQPRTFPSMTPDNARVVFSWPRAEPSTAQRVVLDGLAARVVRLGHSSSLVTVHVPIEATPSTWVPDETGELHSPANERVLRVVDKGQLEALDRVFEHHRDEPGRIMPAAFQRYVRPRSTSVDRAPTTVFGQDWIVLRRVSGPRLPSTRGVDVARAVRSALLKSYGEAAPEILSGHRAPSQPSERPHVAIVPLPFVGHSRADGSLLGVAIVLPSAATREERRAVYRAISTWRSASKASDGESLLPVFLGRGLELSLAVVEEETSSSTLLARTWCERALTWVSATPVALDRNPGDLRSSDPRKEAAAYLEAEQTIATACEHIGLPRPAQVVATPASPIAGGDKARQFPPYLTGKPPIQRVLVHASLTFDRPIDGPVLLGAGRYLGLGLFRPARSHG